MPKTNAAGVALIESFEGLVLHAYPDPGTGGAPWTIGYGHTGPDVHPGMTITPMQAHTLLLADLTKFEEAVNAMLGRSVNSNQFSALVSFAYNEGPGTLQESPLLRYVNAGDFGAAANEFLHYEEADGEVLPGLIRRRHAERALFLKPE